MLLIKGVFDGKDIVFVILFFLRPVHCDNPLFFVQIPVCPFFLVVLEELSEDLIKVYSIELRHILFVMLEVVVDIEFLKFIFD